MISPVAAFLFATDEASFLEFIRCHDRSANFAKFALLGKERRSHVLSPETCFVVTEQSLCYGLRHDGFNHVSWESVLTAPHHPELFPFVFMRTTRTQPLRALIQQVVASFGGEEPSLAFL
jgi:hypothetical protein